MDSFRDKIAIVTGGGSGIGRSLALALAAEGAHVVITDIVQQRLDAVVAELRAKGVRADGLLVDHADEAATRAFAEWFLAAWGRVDVLCCNAGVGHGAKFEEIPLEEWRWVLGVNLWGVIYMLHLFAPSMIERRSGSILITASAAGLTPAPAMSAYNLTKAAMVSLGETLNMEFAPYNIGVTALCPGIINTAIVSTGKIHFGDAATSRSAQDAIVKFYRERGVSPDVVARDALAALRRNTAIKPSPFHVWPLYLLHRVSNRLYHRLLAGRWKKGQVMFLPPIQPPT